MARSLIRQLEQIRRSMTYDDTVANVNSSSVAEPTVSGSLEGDMNVIRTLIKDAKGTTNWFDALSKYFDPSDTDAANTANKDLTLSNIGGNTLDAKTIILPVRDDNSGSGFSVNGSSTGFLLTTTAPYATASDRRGLPIFASTAHNGSYYDEGGEDRVCMIDVVDMNTGSQIKTDSGHIIYGKFHDAADFSGTGTGTDVYVRFYANDAVTDLSTVSGTTPSTVQIVYPRRKILTDVEEYEWARTDFINSWEGDVELMEDIYNLWGYTGATDGDGSPLPWDNDSASYILSSNPSDLKSAIDALNDGIGNRLYTDDNYIADGQTITASLDAIDQELKTLNDSITASSADKYVETVSSAISKNTEHTLPGSISYTPDSTSGAEGKNMDVYVDGQLIAASTGTNGANGDRDYSETSTTSVTFMFDIQAGRNITYVIRQ